MSLKNKHFYWLDACRFIAAFMVLISHCRNVFFPEYGALPEEQHNLLSMMFTLFCRLGHEAVIVFFVLSGFLVGGRGLERIKNGTMNVGSYIIDRFSRITPPLLMAILFCGITSWITGRIEFSLPCAIGNLFCLQGICCPNLVSPFWSLSYEVWFYVILGSLSILAKSINDNTKLWALIIFVCAVSVFVFGLKMHYLLIWFMGAFSYIKKPNNKNTYVTLLSFLGLIVTVLFWQLSKDTHYLKCVLIGTNKEFVEIIMALMVCLFIQQIILYEPHSRFTTFVEKKLGEMAKFSYTLYLSHFLVFYWITTFLWHEDICQFTLTGLSIFVAVVCLTMIGCYWIYFVSERFSPNIRQYLKRQFQISYED